MTPEELATIPEELKALSQWVVWSLEQRGDKTTKMPKNARIGRHASTTDPSTWSSFEQTARALARGSYSGLGFVFSPDDPFTGIDLDKCIGEDGTVEPWALAIVERMNSYTEISPSGRGLHIFVRASLPEGGRRKGSIEMYNQERYFTVTGRRFECPA